jgi:hypothetical protein
MSVDACIEFMEPRGLTGPRQPEVFVAFWDAVYGGL